MERNEIGSGSSRRRKRQVKIPNQLGKRRQIINQDGYDMIRRPRPRLIGQ
jgi:hypothetical protein